MEPTFKTCAPRCILLAVATYTRIITSPNHRTCKPRSPGDHIHIRILEVVVLEAPLSCALESLEPECRILMFLWSLGPLEMALNCRPASCGRRASDHPMGSHGPDHSKSSLWNRSRSTTWVAGKEFNLTYHKKECICRYMYIYIYTRTR